MSNTTLPQAGPLPYEDGYPPNWAADICKCVIAEENGRHYVAGPCPRCTHDMKVDVSEQTGVALTPGKQLVVRCDCDQPHPGRTAGRGCGAHGYVVF